MSSGEVLAKPNELREQKLDMVRHAHSARAGFNDVEGDLDDLSTRFRGTAAKTFDEQARAWKTSADGLVESLDGMATFLGSVAESFESVDSGLASGLNEGGGSGVSTLILASVEELRALARAFRHLTDMVDGDAKQLLRNLGLDERELGGRRTHDSLGDFHRGWSDARKKLVASAEAAEKFLDTAATSYEDLDQQLRSAMTGSGGGSR